MFFVFPPPLITNHPSQTFAKFQRFHLCSFFLIQGSFDFVVLCCVVLCCVSRALTHKSHKLRCCDSPATPEFVITGPFAAWPDLVKRSVCVCVFRNVRSYSSPPDLIVPSRLRIHPENICWAEAIVSRSPLTHTPPLMWVCVCLLLLMLRGLYRKLNLQGDQNNRTWPG